LISDYSAGKGRSYFALGFLAVFEASAFFVAFSTALRFFSSLFSAA
jgi:hypothetical protein